MILALHGSGSRFRNLQFKPGLNVVLAERSAEADDRDSRNGLGKSTVIQLIHFCLGANAPAGKMPNLPVLKGWSFGLDLQVGGNVCAVSRSVDKPIIELRASHLPAPQTLTVKDWTAWLGERVFGLEPADEGKHRPTFRSLISYFARRDPAAYLNPFETVPKQPGGQTQVLNAFLLGLDWADQAQAQNLRDQMRGLDQLKASGALSLLPGLQGSLGELEAEKVRREAMLHRDREALDRFQVHPQYRDIEKEASALTQAIHDVGNQLFEQRRMIEYYQAALREETPAEASQVERLYREAGVALGEAVVRTLAEAEEFHHKIVVNRRRFLAGEIERLEAGTAHLEARSREMTDRRAALLTVLKHHGALEEYEKLVQRLGEQESVLRELEQRIENLRKLETGKAEIKARLALHAREARLDFDEREPIRDKAIRYFNDYSQELYEAPGNLILEMDESANLKLKVDILREGSRGVETMKIFCYDLTLAALWAERGQGPGFLIHDSLLFDGVDERQIARALELAHRESERLGFQYICFLNSDRIPYREFSPAFRVEDHVVHRFTDGALEGRLFGFQF